MQLYLISIQIFINKKEASFDDMKKLINTVKDAVQKKTGVIINLEIVIVE